MPRQRRRRGDFAVAAALATVALAGLGVAAGDGAAEFDYRKLSGIIIPGFASTQLRAWSVLDCPYSPFDFNPLDSVWLDSAKLFSAVNCWLKCMLLEPYNQTDNPECKSRPDSGLSAITELDPGYITGPLSSVWKEWVKWCVEFGIEANAIIAVPYDWRLPPSMLEERDLYFHKLKLTFEIALKLRGGPSLVFAHSMGNNVFRYFLEWLKLEIAPKHYLQWLDEHIHAYFAVGAPLLGSTEAVRAALSGTTFGLPVSEGTARLMFNAFASSLWLMPFSKYCKADNIYWKNFFEGKGGCPHRQQCDEAEYISDYSGWPTDLVNIEVPSVRDMGAYPSIMDITENITSSMECGKPTLLSFSAREVSDGTLFKTIEDYDPQSKALVYQLEKQGIQLREEDKDQWNYIWGARKYTPKNYYNHIYKDFQPPRPFLWIWSSRCCNKLRVFSWLLLMDRLNTRNLLKRKKFKIEGNNYNCVLCASHREETAMHLFFTCPFAIRCWQTVGIQWQYGTPFFQMMEIAKRNFNSTFFMEIFIIAAWHIWKQRNGLIFENCPVSINRWNASFVDECRNQAHRMKDSLKTPFITWINTVV